MLARFFKGNACFSERIEIIIDFKSSNSNFTIGSYVGYFANRVEFMFYLFCGLSELWEIFAVDVYRELRF